MKDQVALSKNNGELCIVIPLYRDFGESLCELPGYTIAMFKDVPQAYIVDVGNGITPQLMSALITERNLEFLGEL